MFNDDLTWASALRINLIDGAGKERVYCSDDGAIMASIGESGMLHFVLMEDEAVKEYTHYGYFTIEWDAVT